MTCRQQLNLLLWKNYTSKKRQPILSLMELLIPLILIIIMVILRSRLPPIPHGKYQPASQPLLSAGIMPVLQTMCSAGRTEADENGFIKYPDSWVDQGFRFIAIINDILENTLTDIDETNGMSNTQGAAQHEIKQNNKSISILDQLKEMTKHFETPSSGANPVHSWQPQGEPKRSQINKQKSGKGFTPDGGASTETSHRKVVRRSNVSRAEETSNNPVDKNRKHVSSDTSTNTIEKLWTLICGDGVVEKLADKVEGHKKQTLMYVHGVFCKGGVPVPQRFQTDAEKGLFSSDLTSNDIINGDIWEEPAPESSPAMPCGRDVFTDISVENRTEKIITMVAKTWMDMETYICGAPAHEPNITDDSRFKRVYESVALILGIISMKPTIMYAPQGGKVDDIINTARPGFGFIDDLDRLSKVWLNVSLEIRRVLLDKMFFPGNTTFKEVEALLTELVASPDPRWRSLVKNLTDIIHYSVRPLADVKSNYQAILRVLRKLIRQALDKMDAVACSWLAISKFFQVTDPFKGFDSEAELISYYQHGAREDKRLPFAGLVFDPKTVKKIGPHVTYKIRLDASFTGSTRVQVPKFWYYGPNDMPNLYYHLGFVWIQDVIERSIISNIVGHTVLEPGTYIQHVPYPSYDKDQFLFATIHLFPLFVTLAWLFTVAVLVRNIVHEKEERLKENMRLMGMVDGVYWFSWFITTFVQTTIISVCFVAIVKLGNILIYSNYIFLFLFAQLYSISVIVFGFVVSCIFTNTKLAAAASGVIYLITYLPYMFVSIKEEADGQVPNVFKYLACLLPTSAMGLAGRFIGQAEMMGSGVQWDNFGEFIGVGDTFSLRHICVMLGIDTFICIILVWYLDKVFPGDYGLPRPWYFPLMRSYWKGEGARDAEKDCSCPCTRLGNWCDSVFQRIRNCCSRSGKDESGVDKPGQEWVEFQPHWRSLQDTQSHFETEPSNLKLRIQIQNLSKVYSNGKRAVDNLNLNLYEGEILSFLGHNGAGKTTTMSILTGILPPSEGTAKIYGRDIRTDMTKIRKGMGFCPQHNVLFESLSVQEHLWFYAQMKTGRYDTRFEGHYEEIRKLLRDTGLAEKRYDVVGALSGGMKRKLCIAIAFIGGSRTVILDEPTAGIDPYSRRDIWQLLTKYKPGRTVMLSTHHMDEADILGDRVAIISGGNVKCLGSSLFLKSTFGQGYHLFLAKRMKDLDEPRVNPLEEESDEDTSSISSISTHSKNESAADTRSSMDESFYCSTDSEVDVFQSDCDVKKVTRFIKINMPGAKLIKNRCNELEYILPFSGVKNGGYQFLFDQLDKNLNRLQLTSFAVTDSSLEEVFLRVTKAHRTDNKPDVLCSDARIEVDEQGSQPANPTSTRPHARDFVDDSKTSVSRPQARFHRRQQSEDLRSIQWEPSCSVRRYSVGVGLGVGRTRSMRSGGMQGSLHTDQHRQQRTEEAIAMEIIADKKPLRSLRTQPGEGAGTRIVGGPSFIFQQFYSCLLKRFHYTRRNWKGIVAQVFLPALFICVALFMSSVAPEVGEEPPLVLTPAQYFNITQPEGNFIPYAKHNFPRGYSDADPDKIVGTFKLPAGVGSTCLLKNPHDINNPNGTLVPDNVRVKYFIDSCQSVMYHSVKCRHTFNLPVHVKEHGVKLEERWQPSPPPEFEVMTKDIIQDISGTKEKDFLLDTLMEYAGHRYGALSYGLTRFHYPKCFRHFPYPLDRTAIRNVAKVWFDMKGEHSVGTYLNVHNNAILRANLPDRSSMGSRSAYGITVINHPMKGTLNVQHMMISLLTPSLVTTIFTLTGMAFIPASFVLFIVHERSTQAKHLQFVSGLNPLIYWLSNYIWDILNYSIPAVVCILMFKVFSLPAFSYGENFSAVCALICMYGVSMMPLMYPLTFIFKEPSSSYIVMVIVNLFSGLGSISIIFLLQFLDFINADNFATMNGGTFSDVSDVVRKAFMVLPNFCLGQGLVDLMVIHLYRTLEPVMPMVDIIGKKQPGPFHWSMTGSQLVAMAAVGIGAFIFTILCEYNFFIRPRIAAEEKLPPVLEEDEDVALERKRIERTVGQNDALRLQNLTKIYTNRAFEKHIAVRRLCLGIPQGQCFGLLGVNGAGKTTTFKMMTGDIHVTGGSVSIMRHSVTKELNQVRKDIGYCPQFDALFGELTGREHLVLYARLRGVPNKDLNDVVGWALVKLDITMYADRPVSTYSGGNKRKLSTAIALLGNPSVIFLDEPTAGMDPYAKRFLWDLILDLVGQGRCIVLTSHSMEECEMLCNRMAIMVNGRFRCLGSVQHLKNKFGEGYNVQFDLKGPDYMQNTFRVIAFMETNFTGVILKECHHTRLEFELSADTVNIANIFRKMEIAMTTLPIKDYSVNQNTLDNVFINFVREQREMDAADEDPGDGLSPFLIDDEELEMSSQMTNRDYVDLSNMGMRMGMGMGMHMGTGMGMRMGTGMGIRGMNHNLGQCLASAYSSQRVPKLQKDKIRRRRRSRSEDFDAITHDKHALVKTDPGVGDPEGAINIGFADSDESTKV